MHKCRIIEHFETKIDKIIELIDKSTITVGDFKPVLSITDRTTR